MHNVLVAATRALPMIAALAALQGSAAAQACATCVPLSDLGAATYAGEMGGLYPGGSNDAPPAHAAAALRAARNVVPCNAAGAPHPDGLVGVLSMGVSHCAQEWREFTRRVDGDATRNGHLVLIDGAINGASSDRMHNPQSIYWPIIEDRVRTAGLTPEQVQVVFLETSRFDAAFETFPGRAQAMRDELADMVREVRVRYTSVRIVFATSLIYAGYSAVNVTEPNIYENGFAIKWLIEDQIGGDPALNHDARNGPIRAPVLVWGPYLWANGATPRADGLVWLPSDMEGDGFHPSDDGEAKVADLYERFLAESAPARVIFRARSGVTRDSQAIDADASLDMSQPGVPLGTGPTIDVELPDGTALARAVVAPFTGTLRHVKLALEPFGRTGDILAIGVSNTGWDENTVTAASAPAFDGTASLPIPLTSKTSLAEWNVTPWTRQTVPVSGGSVTFGLQKTTATLLAQFFAHEAGRPGWLTVVIDREPGGVEGFCAAFAGTGGTPAILGWTGSASLAANDLAFSVVNVPPQAVILPLVGEVSTETPLAGGDICVGGVLVRLPLLTANSLGRASFAVDWTASGTSVLPGDSRTVQAVYRDVVPEGFRTTSAVIVAFRL